MTDEDSPTWTFRAPTRLIERLDRHANEADTSRADLLRKAIHFMLEAHADDAHEAVDLDSQRREQIEHVQDLQQLLPSKVRSHFRDLFVKEIKQGTSADDLRWLGQQYRQQAATMNDEADLYGVRPDVDRREIVQDELETAVEMASVDTFDGGRDAYKRRLHGVQDGLDQRRDLANAVQAALETHEHLVGVDTATITSDDLPPMFGTLLPDDATREQAATIITDLLQQGIAPDDVHDELLGTDSDVQHVPSDTPTSDPDERALPGEQTGLASIPAVDGGRDPDAVTPDGNGTHESTQPMTNTNDDDTTTSDEPTDNDQQPDTEEADA